MGNKNNSVDDFNLESSNPYEKFSNLTYDNRIYEYFLDKDYFSKNMLYNFLMSFPDLTPSMLKVKKDELAMFAAIVMSNKHLVELWYENLSADDKNFLKEIVKYGFIGTEDAQKKYNFKLKKKSYSWYEEIDYMCAEYPLSYFFDYSKYIVTIKAQIRHLLLHYIEELKTKKTVITDDEFKQSRYFLSEENGLVFLQNLPEILETLRSDDFFNRTVDKPIIKKYRDEILAFADVTPLALADELINDYQYDKKDAEAIQNLRIDVFLKFLSCSYMKYIDYGSLIPDFNDYDVEPKVLIKNLLDKYFNNYHTYFEFSYLFPHVKIRNKNQENYSLGYAKSQEQNEILNFFKKWKYDSAVSFEELAQNYFPCFLYTTCNMYTSFLLSHKDNYYNSFESIILNQENSFSLFFIPVFHNLLLVFACLGFFKISWKPCEIKYDEPNIYRFGKIEYIKMTALGRYVFGIDEELTISETKKVAPIVLDTKMEIINCPEENRFALRTVNEICEKLSPEVYCFSKDKFLKKAKSEKKINAYFDILENLSEKKLPDFWEKLKENILSSVCSLTYDDSWIIVDLPMENKRLIKSIEEFIFYNPGKVLKVQGGKIAVKNKNLDYFKEYLKRNGFVLD